MAPLALVDRIIVLENGRVAIDGPKDLVSSASKKSRKVMGSFIRNSALLIIIWFLLVFWLPVDVSSLTKWPAPGCSHSKLKEKAYSPNLTGDSLR